MSGPEDQQPEFDEEAYAEWLDMTNEERKAAGLLTTLEPQPKQMELT